MTLKKAGPLPQGTNPRCNLCSRGFPWDQIEVSLHWNHILASVASRLLIRWSSHALPLGNPAYDSTNQYSISNYGIFLLKTLQWIPNSLSLSINYCFNWCLLTHPTSLSVNIKEGKSFLRTFTSTVFSVWNSLLWIFVESVCQFQISVVMSPSPKGPPDHSI